jgi:hypothetical protein
MEEWIHSKAMCNPSNWGIDTRHRERVSYSRDDSVSLMYNSVRLDAIQPTNKLDFAVSRLGYD